MKSKLLHLNIGNTYSSAALWNGQGFELLPRFRTAELTADSFPPGIPIIAATVVPSVKERLAGRKIHYIDAQTCGKLIDFTKVDCGTLGADRVANAIALAAFHKLPAIAIDCGTAITLEVVDANRVFRGGAIAPGRMVMRQALAAKTAQLPEISFSDELPEQIGNGTVESIRFGIDRGAVGLVRELVEAAARSFGGLAAVTTVVTGGDAHFFAAALPFLQLEPEQFTLHGIRLAGEA